MSSFSLFTGDRHGIDSAVKQYGARVDTVALEVVVYNGEPLTGFLCDRGADYQDYQEVLRLSRIGNAFTELLPGRQLVIPKRDTFSRHPEA